MISLLVPTRKRPHLLVKMIESVLNTADHPEEVEFILYVEDTDHSYDDLVLPPQAKMKQGPRKNLSQLYEWERGTGPIYVLGSDDFIYHTKGWDTKVIEEFEKYPDKILLVYGDDGNPDTNNTNASMPFIHLNWIKTLGRYLPPYFTGDFTDTWLNALAEGVNRKVKIDIYTEAIHPAFGKRDNDDTDKIKWDIHFGQNMPQLYLDTAPEREEDIIKLKAFIENFKQND